MAKKRVAVQIGHIPDEGAPHETEVTKTVAPFVVDELKRAGYAVDVFGKDIPAGQTHDAAVCLHADDCGRKDATGFSIGYWKELLPNSEALARTMRDGYATASGLKFIGFNISIGEHHYYGFRRWKKPAAVVLIELGFCTNPKERAFMLANAETLGRAVARSMIKYLGGSDGGKEKEMAVARDNSGPVPVKEWRISGLVGGSKKALFYVDIANASDEAALVRVVLQRKDVGTYGDITRKVKASAPHVSDLDTFEVGAAFGDHEIGNFSLRFISDQPVVIVTTLEYPA